MFGDLRFPKGTSAGGRYDADGHMHGGPDSKNHHAGDLGNIKANDQGVAKVNVKVEGLRVHFVLGRWLVVHADPDDFKTQPSGNRAIVWLSALSASPKSKRTPPPLPQRNRQVLAAAGIDAYDGRSTEGRGRALVEHPRLGCPGNRCRPVFLFLRRSCCLTGRPMRARDIRPSAANFRKSNCKGLREGRPSI